MCYYCQTPLLETRDNKHLVAYQQCGLVEEIFLSHPFFPVFILEGFSYVALRMIMWLLQHVLGIHSNLLGNKSNLSAGYFFLLISLMPLISKYLLPMRLKPLTYSGKLLSVDRKCVFAHFYKAFFSPKTIIPRFRRF